LVLSTLAAEPGIVPLCHDPFQKVCCSVFPDTVKKTCCSFEP
jgi:hypothetical protein